MQTSVKKEEEEINYVDPGYNDKKVSDLKNFLDKN